MNDRCVMLKQMKALEKLKNTEARVKKIINPPVQIDLSEWYFNSDPAWFPAR